MYVAGSSGNGAEGFKGAPTGSASKYSTIRVEYLHSSVPRYQGILKLFLWLTPGHQWLLVLVLYHSSPLTLAALVLNVLPDSSQVISPASGKFFSYSWLLFEREKERDRERECNRFSSFSSFYRVIFLDILWLMGHWKGIRWFFWWVRPPTPDPVSCVGGIWVGKNGSKAGPHRSCKGFTVCLSFPLNSIPTKISSI